MAEDKKATTAEKPATAADIVKSQAAYKDGGAGEHSDLVEVTITKDGSFLKAGQKKRVHPTMALILKEKGLIDNLGKPYTHPELKQKDITIDV